MSERDRYSEDPRLLPDFYLGPVNKGRKKAHGPLCFQIEQGLHALNERRCAVRVARPSVDAEDNYTASFGPHKRRDID